MYIFSQNYNDTVMYVFRKVVLLYWTVKILEKTSEYLEKEGDLKFLILLRHSIYIPPIWGKLKEVQKYPLWLWLSAWQIILKSIFNLL